MVSGTQVSVVVASDGEGDRTVYEIVVRVHLDPGFGKKRLYKLSGADVRLFLRRVEHTCLCCLHGTDAKRNVGDRGGCAVGECCEMRPSLRLRQQLHAVLRNALEAVVREELICRNVAKLVKIFGPSYKINPGLTVDHARSLLVSARNERLHALYVLAALLDLRRGGGCSLEVTMTIYAHTALGEKRAVLRKLGDRPR